MPSRPYPQDNKALQYEQSALQLPTLSKGHPPFSQRLQLPRVRREARPYPVTRERPSKGDALCVWEYGDRRALNGNRRLPNEGVRERFPLPLP